MAINGVQFDLLLMAITWMGFLVFATMINAINGVLFMAVNENSTINDINAINGY